MEMGINSKRADYEKYYGKGASTFGIIELINNKKEILDNEIGQKINVCDLNISWTSPIAPDYLEYFDDKFLDALGIKDYTEEKYPLSKFWPPSGPRWDALGCGNGKGFIVEAKSHIPEMFGNISEDTKPESLEIIKNSLNTVYRKIRAYGDATPFPGDWTKVFYQYANRLAHLYYLRVLNELDVYLVFVYFLNDPYWGINSIPSKEKWEGVISTVKNYLGFCDYNHALSDYVIDIFIDYGKIL